jgi:hypothetical protein
MALSNEMSGGLKPEQDLVFPSKPDDPEMRESISVWMFDEKGRFGFPRSGIEAEAHRWDNRMVQGNFAFADGRILNGAADGVAHSPFGPEGKPNVLGAGPLAYRCVEPFKRWVMTWDGPVIDSRVKNQITNSVDRSKTIPAKLEAELTMVVPAWTQVTSDKPETLDATLMGLGYRFEQLFRATGVFTVDGKTHDFTATGLRVHRQSIRRLEGFYGHCWQSAVFPDGRAFGYIAYPAKADGTGQYQEGFVYENGTMYEARPINEPWLKRLKPMGDDVGVELEYERGRIRIEGSTIFSTFRVNSPDMPGFNLQQGGALYKWGGQSAYGMIERSTVGSLTEIDV